MFQGIIHRYAERFPVEENTPMVTISEGNTPLISLRNIGRKMPGLEVFAKI